MCGKKTSIQFYFQFQTLISRHLIQSLTETVLSLEIAGRSARSYCKILGLILCQTFSLGAVFNFRGTNICLQSVLSSVLGVHVESWMLSHCVEEPQFFIFWACGPLDLVVQLLGK